MPDERPDLDKLSALHAAFVKEHEALSKLRGVAFQIESASQPARGDFGDAMRNAFPALLALAREAERWKALATKAAPAMAFCAGRTDHHATSVAAGIAWCNEFKDARNGIPQLAGEEEPSGE